MDRQRSRLDLKHGRSVADEFTIGCDCAVTAERPDLNVSSLQRANGGDGIEGAAPQGGEQREDVPASFDFQAVEIESPVVDAGIFVDD